MSDLEEIRQRRMAELQAQQAAMQNQQQQAAIQAQQQEAQRQQFEAQKIPVRSDIETLSTMTSKLDALRFLEDTMKFSVNVVFSFS